MLAPKLRFPEFTEAWEKCQLGSVCSKGEYGMNAASIKYNGRDKYIRISDIDDDTHQYIQDNPVSPDGITDTKYRVREDDILLARTGSVGKSYIYNHDDGNLYYAGFLIRFHVLPGNESQFIYYQTLLGRYRKWVARTSMRSIQPGINAKEYASYEIYMPSKLAEQKKIIKLFNCIDTRITTHTKLLTLLNMYKRGVLQQIFTQKLRFKTDDGKDYPEWEKCKLGSICNITTGKLNANKMNKIGTYKFFTCSKQDFYIDSYSFDGDAILIAGNGDVGFTKIYSGKFDAYQRTYVLMNFLDNITFVKNSIDFYLPKKINRELNIGTMPFIKLNTLLSLEISIPYLEEQEKIASFLNKIDEKIKNENNILIKLKEMKKSLLQQMFI